MIECFFDDSGKQEDTNFVTIAGFLADTSYWNAFVVDWIHLNRRWQVRQVHMKELMRGVGDFKDWDEIKKKKAVSEYVAVISKYKLIGLGISVDAKFWNKLPRQFQKTHGSAHEFCFERMLRRIRDMMIKAQDRDFITVTFDYDRDFAKPRLTRFQNIVDRDPWAKENVVSIGFANAWAYAPLQAADMLAWETNRMLEVQHNGIRPSFGSETMFNGPNGIEFSVGEFWDEHEFNKSVDIDRGKPRALGQLSAF